MSNKQHEYDTDGFSALIRLLGNSEIRHLLVNWHSSGVSPPIGTGPSHPDNLADDHQQFVEDLLRLGLAERDLHGVMTLTERVRISVSDSHVQIVLTAADGSSVDVTYPVTDE